MQRVYVIYAYSEGSGELIHLTALHLGVEGEGAHRPFLGTHALKTHPN